MKCKENQTELSEHRQKFNPINIMVSKVKQEKRLYHQFDNERTKIHLRYFLNLPDPPENQKGNKRVSTLQMSFSLF